MFNEIGLLMDVCARCDECGSLVPLHQISSILRKAESYIKNNLGGGVDNDILERMLEVLGTSLHSNHYLLAQVCM